jgi:hypothetical protein
VPFFAGLVLLTLCHVGSVNHFIPISAVFSNEPLHGMAYDRHVGQVFRVATALDRWGKTWLYDVQLLAGQPEGTLSDLDSKGWELWTFVLCWLGVPGAIAFNSFVLLVMLAGPALVYSAARIFGLSAMTRLLAAVMASTLWFFDSYLHWAWFAGMISWCGAACLAPLALALYLRWLRTGAVRDAALVAAVLALGLLLHAGALAALVVPLIAAHVWAFRATPRANRFVPLVMLIFAVGVNAYWIHNAATHWKLFFASPPDMKAESGALLCDLLDVRCGDLYGGMGTLSNSASRSVRVHALAS